jgi:hypothetical protein
MVGQFSAPAFSIYGRPSLSPGDLGRIPATAEGTVYGNQYREDNLIYQLLHESIDKILFESEAQNKLL